MTRLFVFKINQNQNKQAAVNSREPFADAYGAGERAAAAAAAGDCSSSRLWTEIESHISSRLPAAPRCCS